MNALAVAPLRRPASMKEASSLGPAVDGRRRDGRLRRPHRATPSAAAEGRYDPSKQSSIKPRQ